MFAMSACICFGGQPVFQPSLPYTRELLDISFYVLHFTRTETIVCSEFCTIGSNMLTVVSGR